MRRRAASAHSEIPEPHHIGDRKQTGKGKDIRRRRVGCFPNYVVGHPLFGFFLFLALFPGYALISHSRKLCAEGELPGCRHNHPRPFLTRSSQTFFPNWRPDGRCGSNFPAPSGHLSAVCNPFATKHCCSQWGYCGTGPEYCAQAVKSPFNLTGTGDTMKCMQVAQSYNAMQYNTHHPYLHAGHVACVSHQRPCDMQLSRSSRLISTKDVPVRQTHSSLPLQTLTK